MSRKPKLCFKHAARHIQGNSELHDMARASPTKALRQAVLTVARARRAPTGYEHDDPFIAMFKNTVACATARTPHPTALTY